jgi:hypothetical protein
VFPALYNNKNVYLGLANLPVVTTKISEDNRSMNLEIKKQLLSENKEANPSKPN